MAESQHKNSNFRPVLGVSQQFCHIFAHFALEQLLRASVYSPGIRYFYWEFYKNNSHEKRLVLGRNTYEGNEGYALCDWFIAKKYANLKEELLSNRIITFAKDHFDDTLFKAKQKL